MIEIGHYSLAAAVLAALGVILASVAAVRLERPGLLGVARQLTVGGAVFLTLAAVAMLDALLGDNFTLQYVAEHSERAMSWPYKLAAFWAGQEGSVLLWAWALGVMSLAALRRQRGGGEKELAARAVTLAVVWGFFAAMMLFAADPFAATPVRMADGQGLNPLLQNPAMVAHPPVLFLGYAACTIPFALLVGALAAGVETALSTSGGAAMDAGVVVVLLTVGIVLGAWWAYVELGWGGYWAWDPVENASLLPWLTATAALHTLKVQQQRGMMKRFSAGLIVATFWLCILATYLTRSGVVQSVHAFEGGLVSWFFLVFLGLGVAATVGMLAWRWGALRNEQEIEGLVSREGMLLGGSVLLVVMMLTTLVGTVFPLLSAPFGRAVSVGPAFYNKVVGPMGLALALLMAAGPVLWRKSAKEMAKALGGPAVVAVAGVAVGAALGLRNEWALAATGMGMLALAAMVVELARATVRSRRPGENILLTAVRLVAGNHRRYGAQLAHVGVVLMVFGIVGSSVFKQEQTLQMKAGETAKVGRYTLGFDGLAQTRGANYDAVEAVVRAADPRGGVMELRPQKRFYFKSEQPYSEVAIRPNWREDLYLSLAGWEEGGEVAAIGVIVNPLVSWIWIGAAVMALGGVVCLVPPRARQTTVAEAKAARPTNRVGGRTVVSARQRKRTEVT